MSGLQAWHAAESSLGRPRAVERAAGRLPERQAWLLRAMQALDDGRREEVHRVAEAARAALQPDIAAVLDLLLADPDHINPTAVRKAAKTAGLDAQTRLPFLDLLRSLAAFRAGPEKPAPKALAQAAREPGVSALDAVVSLLTSRSKRVWRHTDLEKKLLRAGQVVLVAQHVRKGLPVQPELLRLRWSRLLVDLSPARWPDLNGSHEATLRARLAGEQPWHAPHDEPSEWLYRQPDKRGWLGGLLRALPGHLQTGRLQLARNIAHAAGHLSRDLGLGGLGKQLLALEDRLEWIEVPDAPLPQLLEALWREAPERLRPAERDRLAKLVLRLEHHIEDEAIVDQAAARAAGFLPPRLELLDLLGMRFQNLGRPAARALMRAQGVDEARLALCDQVLAALGGNGTPPDPLGRASTDPEGAAMLVVSSVVGGPPGSITPSQVAWAAELLGRLEATDAAWAATVLLEACQQLPPPFEATLHRWSTRPPDAARPLGEFLALLALAEHVRPDLGSAALKRLLRDEGRRLRAMDPNAADQRALWVLASGLGSLIPQNPWMPDIFEALEPLARFLLRGPPDRLLPCLDNLPAHAQMGLEAWYQHHPEAFRGAKGWEARFGHSEDIAPAILPAQLQKLFESMLGRP